MKTKLLLLSSLLSLGSTLHAETAFTDYDKHKAVITCMQKIYVERYRETPALEDAFPLCEQRFVHLQQTLSHEDFLRHKTRRYEFIEGEDYNSENPYYDTLYGIPDYSDLAPE